MTTTATAAPAIRYTTGKTFEYGIRRSVEVTFYVAEVGDLRINIDRDPSTDYLAWSVFVTRTTPDAGGEIVETVLTTYAQTLREAKAAVAAFVAADQADHAIRVGWVPNNHGYPYRATCSCGWASNTYAATHAAQSMADDHLKGVTA